MALFFYKDVSVQDFKVEGGVITMASPPIRVAPITTVLLNFSVPRISVFIHGGAHIALLHENV